MQLEKMLQSQGFGSRNQCRAIINNRQVRILGQVITDAKAMVDTQNLEFIVAGQTWQYRPHVYLALYKPMGVECSHNPQHHRSVFSLLPEPLIGRGVQCVGRLDQDTTGLLLLTDDGRYLQALTHPRKHVGKQYLLRTVHPILPEQIDLLCAGVMLHGETALVMADSCELVDTHCLRLCIHQGLYHQVKRMIAAVGNRLISLHREQVGQLNLSMLPNLKEGEWVYLDETAVNLSKQGISNTL